MFDAAKLAESFAVFDDSTCEFLADTRKFFERGGVRKVDIYSFFSNESRILVG